MSNVSRAAQTRAATARPMVGGEIKGELDIDVSALPATVEATWIRETCLGQYDANNVRRAMQRGYRPVEAKDLPGYQTFKLPNAPDGSKAPDDGLIRQGGQILMVRDKRVADEEKALYAEETSEALRSVARDTTAPKDGRNFQDMTPEISARIDRGKGRFSE